MPSWDHSAASLRELANNSANGRRMLNRHADRPCRFPQLVNTVFGGPTGGELAIDELLDRLTVTVRLSSRDPAPGSGYTLA